MRSALYFALIGTAVCLTSCEDECDVTCNENEILTIDCECVAQSTDDEILVTNNITEDTEWTAEKVIVLGGRITVTNGATLTIAPGAVIKGQSGGGVNATALVVARGAKLNAVGTATQPIIFTTVADELTPEMVAAGEFSSPNMSADQRGRWGGLIILGNAPISAKNDADELVTEVQIEGIPTSDPNGLYGGNDKEDNSGTIAYVSIRHGGTDIGAGNEINGLTLGAVGSGTSINNIEVVANADDGIEWFGGTVNVNNALVWSCGDDGLDTDQAWNGLCTNWIVAVPAGGSAMELDGPEGDYIDGAHQFTDGIIYCGDNIDHIIDLDDNTNAGINRLYVFGVADSYPGEAGFEPIESFGGDGSGNNGQWEYTLPAGKDPATIFTGVPTAALTEVTLETKSMGPDASDFAWSWGGHSGTLSGLGL